MPRKPADKPLPLVITAIETVFEDRLANLLTRSFERDYELACPPVFVYNGEPAGMNGHAVGFKHPHFLIILRKVPRA